MYPLSRPRYGVIMLWLSVTHFVVLMALADRYGRVVKTTSPGLALFRWTAPSERVAPLKPNRKLAVVAVIMLVIVATIVTVASL